MGFKDLTDKVIGDKRQWREYRARVKRLPEPYRSSMDAIERYLMHVGPMPADWDQGARMLEDLAELFERSAADGTAVRDVIGADPVEFIEMFAANYADGGWMAKEQARLREPIEAAGE